MDDLLDTKILSFSQTEGTETALEVEVISENLDSFEKSLEDKENLTISSSMASMEVTRVSEPRLEDIKMEEVISNVSETLTGQEKFSSKKHPLDEEFEPILQNLSCDSNTIRIDKQQVC